MKLFPWWAFSVVTYLEINNAKMSGNVCSHFVRKKVTLAMVLSENNEKCAEAAKKHFCAKKANITCEARKKKRKKNFFLSQKCSELSTS